MAGRALATRSRRRGRARPDGKYLVRLGGEAEVLTPPKHKDIDIQQVLDVRRMLTGAGYATVVTELEAKGEEV